MYTLAYVLQYLAAIIWNKLFSVRSIKNKKNKSFYFTSTYSFFNMLFCSLCRFKFLTYLIFLFSKKLLIVYWQQIFSVVVCLKNVLFYFIFEELFHRKQNSILLVGFFSKHFKYFTPLFFLWGEVRLILIFNPLCVRCFFPCYFFQGFFFIFDAWMWYA